MGRVSFKSQKVTLAKSPEEVFAFLDDLNNLGSLLPEQVINFKSDSGQCSFDIKGMAHIGLRKSESIPNSSIKISGVEENPLELDFLIGIENSGDGGSVVEIDLTAQLSPMLQLMASSPLQNLVNIMADRFREVMK
jgi:carbon monoxide dehydrogenase subunit G